MIILKKFTQLYQFIYLFLTGDSESVGDLQGFENEWVEVEIKEDVDQDPLPSFLRTTLPHPCSQVDQRGSSQFLERVLDRNR